MAGSVQEMVVAFGVPSLCELVAEVGKRRAVSESFSVAAESGEVT